MTAMSDYLEGKVLAHSLGITSWTMPATVYIALFTTATTDAGGGTEVTGGSYVRAACSFGAGAVANERSNAASVTFTNMPPVTITHAAIMDAVAAGNMLYHGPMTVSVVLLSGNTFTFAAGDIDVQVT